MLKNNRVTLNGQVKTVLIKKAVRLGKNTISSASFLKLHTEYQDSFFLHRYTGSLLINLLTRQKI